MCAVLLRIDKAIVISTHHGALFLVNVTQKWNKKINMNNNNVDTLSTVWWSELINENFDIENCQFYNGIHEHWVCEGNYHENDIIIYNNFWHKALYFWCQLSRPLRCSGNSSEISSNYPELDFLTWGIGSCLFSNNIQQVKKKILINWPKCQMAFWP